MIVTFVTSLGKGYTISVTEKAREQMDNQTAQRLAAHMTQRGRM